jgi:hypothetical protein
LFEFSARAKEVLARIARNKASAPYLAQLQENLLYLVLTQISKIFKTIKLAQLCKFAAFLGTDENVVRARVLEIIRKTSEGINCCVDPAREIVVFAYRKKFALVDNHNRVVDFALGIKMLTESLAQITQR